MALTPVHNAKVEDPLAAAMQAFMSGQDPEEAVYGEGVTSEPQQETPDPLELAEEVEQVGEAEDNQEVSTEAEAPESDVQEVDEKAPQVDTKSFEEVYVKTPEGRRQAVKIDYENRDSIKKAYLKAAGFPVLNAKLANTSKKYQTLEKEHASLKADMDKLEDIYQNQGIEALIKTLGRTEDLDKIVEERLKHKEYLGSLSPDEKYRYDLKQQNELSMKKASEVEAKYKKMMEDIEKKEEAAATRSLESRLHPSFDRYRFSGKLGDEVVEHQLDETIWNNVARKLGEYPEDVELTQGIIDREFRTAAQNLQKVIQMQTERRVNKVVDKKKAEAAKTAQITAKKGLTNSGEKEKFVESIKSGNILEAMSAMSGGRIRL